MTFFPSVKRWLIPEGAFTLSLQEMALDGHRGNEGIALWLGRRTADEAAVSHVAVLRGKGVQRYPALLNVGTAIMNAVTLVAVERGISLVGQVHSHGPGYGTDLSPTDRRMGIGVNGYLSLVAPDYALRSDTQLRDCGIHVFEAGRGFRRLHGSELESRIVLMAGATVEVLTIEGGE